MTRIELKRLSEKLSMIQEKKRKDEEHDKDKPGLRFVPKDVSDQCYFKAFSLATRKKTCLKLSILKCLQDLVSNSFLKKY